MAVSPLESKAHELIGQIGHCKLVAIVHLLEVMVDNKEEDEETSAEEESSRFGALGFGSPFSSPTS